MRQREILLRGGILLPLLFVGACVDKEQAPQSADQRIYRYVQQGRTVFVNGAERVPRQHRARAVAVELSGISTNRDLGNALRDQVSRQAKQLTASPYCRRARGLTVEPGFVGRIWRDHAHLVVLSALGLLLLALSPMMIRRHIAPQWGRVLMLALPLLFLVAVVSTAMVRAGRSMARLRETARLCDPASYPGGMSGALVQQQLQRLNALDAQIRAAAAPRRKGSD